MSPSCESAVVELVVDRVEDGVAAVEVPGGQVVDVLALVLPASLREGDRVHVCVVEAPRNFSSSRGALGRLVRAEFPHNPKESTCLKK
ncbi:MAG: DUF3006 domain-containing protein [Deltaproteobacteria bacterium]|nr:DUF3006 domain-containing protein [Deltaproteobacteria bacterium]